MLFTPVFYFILYVRCVKDSKCPWNGFEQWQNVSFTENSCARTDAVFTPYPGFKSHVKGETSPW